MRKHFTKEYITEALFRLLKEKNIEKITISELVTTAGVSRASFYRNYLDINSVVDEYLANLFGNISEKYPVNTTNIRGNISQFYKELLKNKEELSLLEKNNLLNGLNKYMYKSVLSQIEKLDVFNNKYQPHFFCGASVGVIRAWISYGFKESPDEMSELFMGSLIGYMDLSKVK